MAIDGAEGVGGGFIAEIDVVVAVHEDFRLYDWDKPGFLREGGVARQGVGVDLYAVGAGYVRADVYDGAPLGEACAYIVVLGKSFSQAVQSLGHALAGGAGERLDSGVNLDAGIIPRSARMSTMDVPSAPFWRRVSS